MKELPRLIEFLKMQAIPPSDAMAVEMAGEELFTNTVRHGRTERDGESVQVSVSVNGSELTLVYSDAGVDFDTTLGRGTVAADHAEDVAAMPAGGLGLHFLRRTMQAMHYERAEGRNVTTLTRRLGAGGVAQ